MYYEVLWVSKLVLDSCSQDLWKVPMTSACLGSRLTWGRKIYFDKVGEACRTTILRHLNFDTLWTTSFCEYVQCYIVRYTLLLSFPLSLPFLLLFYLFFFVSLRWNGRVNIWKTIRIKVVLSRIYFGQSTPGQFRDPGMSLNLWLVGFFFSLFFHVIWLNQCYLFDR